MVTVTLWKRFSGFSLSFSSLWSWFTWCRKKCSATCVGKMFVKSLILLAFSRSMSSFSSIALIEMRMRNMMPLLYIRSNRSVHGGLCPQQIHGAPSAAPKASKVNQKGFTGPRFYCSFPIRNKIIVYGPKDASWARIVISHFFSKKPLHKVNAYISLFICGALWCCRNHGVLVMGDNVAKFTKRGSGASGCYGPPRSCAWAWLRAIFTPIISQPVLSTKNPSGWCILLDKRAGKSRRKKRATSPLGSRPR